MVISHQSYKCANPYASLSNSMWPHPQNVLALVAMWYAIHISSVICSNVGSTQETQPKRFHQSQMDKKHITFAVCFCLVDLTLGFAHACAECTATIADSATGSA